MNKTLVTTLGSLLAVGALAGVSMLQPACTLKLVDLGDVNIPDGYSLPDGSTSDGGGGGGGGDGGGTGCPIFESFSTGTAKCDTCAAAACCQQATDCFGNENCKSVAGCIEGCPNDNKQCEDDCRTKLDPGATTSLEGFVKCEADNCKAECQ